MKKYPHETTILGSFDTMPEALHARRTLEDLRFAAEDMKVVSNKEDYEKEELVNMVVGERMHHSSLHAGKMGGITGAVFAGATALTAFLTAGGSLLVAAPLLAIASGAGGALGALVGSGFNEEESRRIDMEVDTGHILLVVHTQNHGQAQNAKEILRHEGAQHVYTHH